MRGDLTVVLVWCWEWEWECRFLMNDRQEGIESTITQEKTNILEHIKDIRYFCLAGSVPLMNYVLITLNHHPYVFRFINKGS